MKVQNIDKNENKIIFEDGSILYSYHENDCCERHELYFKDLNLSDFDGLEFNLSNDKFFERVPGYGIRLIPIKGSPISIAGHGSNNGYYSARLDLVIIPPDGGEIFFNISDCQDIIDD